MGPTLGPLLVIAFMRELEKGKIQKLIDKKFIKGAL